MNIELFESEIAAHDWAALPCPCDRTAAHLEPSLRELVTAPTVDDAGRVADAISDHLVLADCLYEPAVPVVSVLLAALAGDVSTGSRIHILGLLLGVLGDLGQSFSAAAQGRDLHQECRRAAVPGRWLLYRDVMSREDITIASTAYEVVSLLETDTARLRRVKQVAADRLAVDIG